MRSLLAILPQPAGCAEKQKTLVDLFREVAEYQSTGVGKNKSGDIKNANADAEELLLNLEDGYCKKPGFSFLSFVGLKPRNTSCYRIAGNCRVDEHCERLRALCSELKLKAEPQLLEQE